MRSSVLAAVLALLQVGGAVTARCAHSIIVTPDMRLNPAALTPTCGDDAALRLRGGSREDWPLKLYPLPRSGLLTAELLCLLALKIFDVGAISALAPPAPPAPPAQARAACHVRIHPCSSAQVMESRTSGAAPSLISRRDVFVAAILVMQYACWQVTTHAIPRCYSVRPSVC